MHGRNGQMVDPRLPEDIIGKLKEIERRLRWSDAVDLGLRAVCLGLAAGLLLSLLARTLEVSSAPVLLAITGVLVLLPGACAAAYGLTQRRTLLHVARICDRRLGLKERLSTALEVSMGSAQGPLIDAQLMDAWRAAGAIDLARDFALKFPRRSTLVVTVLLAAFLVIFRLPHPASGSLSHAGIGLPAANSLAPDKAGATALTGGSSVQSDTDRLNAMDARLQELANDIARGEVTRAEIVDRLTREEFELRPLLARARTDQPSPARALIARLRALTRSAELSESVRQRDYAEVVRQVRDLDNHLSTRPDDERILAAHILARTSHAEMAINPDISPLLETASTALSLSDRATLNAAIDALQTVITMGAPQPSTAPDATADDAPTIPQ